MNDHEISNDTSQIAEEKEDAFEEEEKRRSDRKIAAPFPRPIRASEELEMANQSSADEGRPITMRNDGHVPAKKGVLKKSPGPIERTPI